MVGGTGAVLLASASGTAFSSVVAEVSVGTVAACAVDGAGADVGNSDAVAAVGVGAIELVGVVEVLVSEAVALGEGAGDDAMDVWSGEVVGVKKGAAVELADGSDTGAVDSVALVVAVDGEGEPVEL